MKYSFTLICLILTLCPSCKQLTNHPTTDKFARERLFIQTCIDSTLSLDRGLNGKNYLVDFGDLQFDRQTIDSFFKLNLNAVETNLDSLITHDSTWIKYRYFENPVIRFEEIVRQKNDTFLIKTSKTKASDGSIRTEIILRRKEDGFECVKSQITWIS